MTSDTYSGVLRRKVDESLRALADGSLSDVRAQRLDEDILGEQLGKSLATGNGFLEASDEFLEYDVNRNLVECERMECQLQLLRMFLALEDRSESDFEAALSELLSHASMWVHHSKSLAAALFECAYVVNKNDATTVARICWSAISWYFERGECATAREWLDRFPTFNDEALDWVRDSWSKRLM